MTHEERIPIALQLWTIREALAADLDGALDRVCEAGFSAVEMAPPPPGLTSGQIAEALHRRGLAVVSIHGDLPTPANIDAWGAIADASRCSKILWHGWPRDPRFDSASGLEDLIAACNEANALVRARGLRFGLHNHWWEFEPVEGERALDRMLWGLDPEIFWQLDVYWARTAGTDPAAVVAELGSRLGSIHWKDGPAIHGEPMTALGRGVVDIAGILRALDGPVDWVIELDECATDPLEAAREGKEYLRGLVRNGRNASWE